MNTTKDLSLKKTHKINSYINLESLPKDLKISTITLTCHFDTLFNVENISKYIDLDKNGIISIRYGDDPKNVRALKITKELQKKINKRKRSFFNQVSLEINIKNKVKPINVKIFKNGSLQMTGCKSSNDFVFAITIVCEELQKEKGVYDEKLKKIIDKPFATVIKNVGINKIKKFKIAMINCNFALNFKINRSELYKYLLKKNINCIFEPCVHACVNIKYNYKNQSTISIFVFESGCIIITGAKNQDHILSAYKFITKLLYENYQRIIKNDVIDIFERPDIMKLLIDE